MKLFKTTYTRSAIAQALEFGKLLEKMNKKVRNKYCKHFSISRSTAYLYMSLYRKFVVELKQHPKHLSTFKLNRLQTIQPVVHMDTTKWLNKARELSLSDLRKEVWGAQGKPERLNMQDSVRKPPSIFEPPSTFIAYVKYHPCLLHPNRESEGHQFLKAGKIDSWKRIPLCAGCVADYHVNTKEFLWLNRVKIFDFFYTLIQVMEHDIAEMKHDIFELQEIKKRRKNENK